KTTGLQAALDAKVPGARVINTAAPLQGAGSLAADLTLSVSVGSAINTVAAGNDPRFPPTADWATAVFGASGTNHGPGLVPDPGAVLGVSKFLREDGNWQVPAGGGGGGSIAVTTLVLKGDNTGAAVAA